MSEQTTGELTIRGFQTRIRDLYGAKDAARGDSATFLYLVEEIGEVATALRSGSDEELALEMADVFAWLVTLASIRGIDLADAADRKYGRQCPGGCGKVPCGCDPAEKP